MDEEESMKRVRILLRVSSNQQLEADGDLTVQRQLVIEYARKQPDWILDEKEYFEGGVSGYKNGWKDRNVLQEILQDADRNTFDILLVYKDDRLGRQLWDTGMYVMALKRCGVDVYSVKDGKISPDSDDPMAQLLLAMRYGIAQKSSSDTGMRVKDTARKLVQKGRFMGGRAPYGYRLELSGELSKHGRALHKLVIESRQAEVVKHIYELSLYHQYGSKKIAKALNQDPAFCLLAPSGQWKAATIASILTNPIYCGYTAYKRREKKNGTLHRQSSADWIRAEKPDPEITLIDEKMWKEVQLQRQMRDPSAHRLPAGAGISASSSGSGNLPLIDVLYCGSCGCKFTNGTRYSYWKAAGEKKKRILRAYKCQNAASGIPHPGQTVYSAEKIESIVFQYVGKYLELLLDDHEIPKLVQIAQRNQVHRQQDHIQAHMQALSRIQKNIRILEETIPLALQGISSVPLPDLLSGIKAQKQKAHSIQDALSDLPDTASQIHLSNCPTWATLFQTSQPEIKRRIINCLFSKITLTSTTITLYVSVPLSCSETIQDT